MRLPGRLLILVQRLRTLTEFRTMAVAPFPIQCKRDGQWATLQTDDLLPGDVVSVGTPSRTAPVSAC